MNEKKLRLTHRYTGIPPTLFVILQAASGIMLSIEDFTGAYYDNIIRDIHIPGSDTQEVCAVSLLGCALSG